MYLIDERSFNFNKIWFSNKVNKSEYCSSKRWASKCAIVVFCLNVLVERTDKSESKWRPGIVLPLILL